MDIVDMFTADEYCLSKKGEQFLAPPNKELPNKYSSGKCKVLGCVPEVLRATYSLIGLYELKLQKAEATRDELTFVALKAMASYKWLKWFNARCQGIKVDSENEIKVLGDWSIAVVNQKAKKS